ncbi:MAG: type II secretion system protein GspL [Gammaproteobacteria bacterium]|nr:type II secretion system protein GspL [Gammaproteobacteria bacterium]
MIVYFQIDAPHRWLHVSRQNIVEDSGVAETLDGVPIPKTTSQIIGVVPGTAVAIRKIDVPARTRRQAEATAPYALEESLATDVEDLHFAVLDWKRGADTTVAVVERRSMDAWREALTDITPDKLVPEMLLLPLHAQTDYTLAKLDDGSVYVRGRDATYLVLDENAVELWWQEMENPHASIAVNDGHLAHRLVELGGTLVHEWNIGGNFQEWLKHDNAPEVTGNLLQGNYLPQERRQAAGGYKTAAALLAAALVIRLVADGFEYVSLRSKDRELGEQIEATFRSAFPDITRIVNPRVQMEQKMRELKTGSAGAGYFQLLLAAVAKAVPPARATLEEINFRENSMIVTCTTSDFAGLDRLKELFAKDQNVRVELLSSGSRDNRVSGRFKLNLGAA